jgi:heme/copper-type cytochrome/quinol oxidase subunit 2
MEYLAMFGSYLGADMITTRVIAKSDQVVDWGKVLLQATIIGTCIVIVTILLNMLRTYRVCQADKDGKKSKGAKSGMILAIWATVFALAMFFFLSFTTMGIKILTLILPFLANYVEVAKGLGVAFSGLIGYFFGRIFTGLC